MELLLQRAREGRRLIAMSIMLNFVLALAKMTGGYFGHSQALIADGMESSLDVLSSLVMWWAIKYAERPPDSDHPYGHGKMESLAAVVGSLFLLLAGLMLGTHSVEQIVHLHFTTSIRQAPAVFTLLILIVTIAAKELFFRHLNRRGKAIESASVQTDAMHHRSDAMTSLAALIGISAALIGGPHWSVVDNWAALFSCALIVYNGLHMLRGSMGEILDQQMDPLKIEEILATARQVPGVSSVEKCRVRKSGFVRIADLHVRVPGNCTVREGHRIAHEVEKRLKEAEFLLVDVTVHIEPEEET